MGGPSDRSRLVSLLVYYHSISRAHLLTSNLENMFKYPKTQSNPETKGFKKLRIINRMVGLW